MAPPIAPPPFRAEYQARIHRVIDHIERHLGHELTLAPLAEVAGFSPFHFHRLFRALTGEPLGQFVQRLRLERAASQLRTQPGKSITEVALDCAFSNSAAFSRAFREAFGVSPSRWRRGEGSKTGTMAGKPGNPASKPGEEPVIEVFYPDGVRKSIQWRFTMSGNVPVEVEVRELPAREVAYLRHVGPYAGNAALFQGMTDKLMRWAGSRGLIRFPETQMFCVYHDDPAITAAEQLRISVCLTVPPETPAEGEVGRMTLDGGRYAVAHFEIDTDQYGEAWDALCGKWLPQSGYQPDDRLSFEHCLNDPRNHPQGKHIVDICLPVRPL